MGRILQRIKLANLFNPTLTMELDAMVDTGATMLALPQESIEKLGLKKLRDARVRYADDRVKLRPVYSAVLLEVLGRTGTFDVLAGVEGSQPLIGNLVLEALDLVVNPAARKLIANPRSPDIPMVDLMT